MSRSSNCVLSEKSNLELAKPNECSHDPGGYIINGQEKVILIQEQSLNNRIILNIKEDSKNCIVASCNIIYKYYSSKKNQTNIIMKEKVNTIYDTIFLKT